MKFTNDNLYTMLDALVHVMRHTTIDEARDSYKELDKKIRQELHERKTA